MKAMCTSCLLATLVTCLIHSDAAAVTIRAPMVLTRNLGRLPNEYSLRAGGNLGAIFTAPDGTVFSGSSVDGLTFSEVLRRFAGQWTITDSFDLPVGAPPQRHFLTLSEADLSIPFPAYPQLLTPADGAKVPPVFEMTWAGEASLAFGEPVDVHFLSNDSANITVEFEPGVVQKSVTLTVRNSDRRRVGVAMPESSGSRNRFEIDVWRQSEAASRTVNVVIPEPSTCILSGVALASLAVLRRRK